MKITVTINLGNYENVSIESSDHPTAADCINEIKDANYLFHDPAVMKYIQKVFGGAV